MAAMPSLRAAFPLLSALDLRKTLASARRHWPSSTPSA
jgi:hypothetical protein